MTVLQIAALKKVNKGTTVLLMDKNGGGAKAVAKELSGRGFRRIFVINGGFQGWTGSKLQTRLSSSVSAIEVLSPGNFFGTQRTSNNTQKSTQVGLEHIFRHSLWRLLLIGKGPWSGSPAGLLSSTTLLRSLL